ncbi:MAG: SDR family oxidoreductase [Vannielia sp.]|uniref:SDR family NAD(P)-dependent oxidoreductase n=1 Tax=Vannielia sp. TaxID=2813045 RepID=UPI003B8D6C63
MAEPAATKAAPGTAVVTGCHGGMGRAIVAALAASGRRVIGIDRPGSDGATPDRFLPCDLADMAAVAALVDTLQGEPVDCLVNCAGHYAIKPVFDLTLEDFDLALAINLRAPFLLSQGLARGMATRGGGSIVMISSIAGKLGSPMVPYGTTKAALIGLTKSLAKTLAPHAIRVNAIAPGVIRTPMAEGVEPEQMAQQMKNVPMARWGEPEEIAGVVGFLAGDASSYMTGAVLDVAGGWMS